MTIIVSDTSPLNYLILLDKSDILPALYGRVLIPQAVFAELKNPETPEKVRMWIATAPAWIEVAQITSAPDASLTGIDEGEREAITLALEIGADALLIDDDDGRKSVVEFLCYDDIGNNTDRAIDYRRRGPDSHRRLPGFARCGRSSLSAWKNRPKRFGTRSRR